MVGGRITTRFTALSCTRTPLPHRDQFVDALPRLDHLNDCARRAGGPVRDIVDADEKNVSQSSQALLSPLWSARSTRPVSLSGRDSGTKRPSEDSLVHQKQRIRSRPTRPFRQERMDGLELSVRKRSLTDTGDGSGSSCKYVPTPTSQAPPRSTVAGRIGRRGARPPDPVLGPPESPEPCRIRVRFEAPACTS